MSLSPMDNEYSVYYIPLALVLGETSGKTQNRAERNIVIDILKGFPEQRC